MFQFVVLIDSVRWLVVIRKNNVWCGVVSNFFETLNDYLLLFWMCYICPSHSFRVAIKNKKMNKTESKLTYYFWLYFLIARPRIKSASFSSNAFMSALSSSFASMLASASISKGDCGAEALAVDPEADDMLIAVCCGQG